MLIVSLAYHVSRVVSQKPRMELPVVMQYSWRLLSAWSPEEIQSALRSDAALSKVIKWLESNSIPHFPLIQANFKDTVASERSADVERRCPVLAVGRCTGGGLHRRLQLMLPVPGVLLSGLHDSPVGGHLNWS